MKYQDAPPEPIPGMLFMTMSVVVEPVVLLKSVPPYGKWKTGVVLRSAFGTLK